MPDGRFLSKTVATDEPLNRLTWQAQAVYMMTVPHLDRDGLITGHPLLLMAQVAPLRAAELVGIMPDIINEWIDAELVTCYQSDDQPALFFPGFLKHQRLPHYDRETPSRFAPPPGYQRADQGLIPVEPPAAPAPSAESVQLPTDSGATPDLLRTQSGPTPPLKQQRTEESKTPRLPYEKSSSNSTKRARARPSPPAAPAARSPGKVKPEIYQALKDFGVAEPALSEISSNGVTPDQVDGWIEYLATQNMQRPVGYLVKRLRAHEEPPAAAADDDDPDSYEALRRKYAPDGWEDVVRI
jgi:hypothetical protein